MVTKINFSQYKFLFIAILISLVWHVFWLSTIKIVVKPGRARQVKFSRVSFLGPILGGGMMVAVEPKERTLLEKRYMNMVDHLPRAENGSLHGPYFEYEAKNTGLARYIDEAVSGEKIEPAALDL